MRGQRKSFRRKVFCRRKGSDECKEKSAEQKERWSHLHCPKETDGHWSWLSDELADQGCRRLDRRQRRLNSELLRAVEQGAVEKVVSCLDRGANVNATCEPLGNTACHLAAFTGNTDILLLLLKRGASPRVLDPHGRSPLHFAAWSGKDECVKLLLHSAMDMLNCPIRRQKAEKQVHLEVLDTWGHDHADIRNQLPQLEPGSTPLHVASQRLHLECIEALLGAGADVTSRDDDGMTPIDVIGEKLVGGSNLHAATKFPDVYEVLLGAGAELLHSHRVVRTTPMHTAVALKSLEAIDMIARSPGVLNLDKNGMSPIHLAVSLRLQTPLRVLLQSPAAAINETSTKGTETFFPSGLAFVDMKDLNGNTPLHTAVASQWRTGVAILLEAGADTCQKNSNGATSLHLAAESGNRDVLEEMLNIPESKTILDAPDNFEDTPLFQAVKSRSVDCVRLLLEAGASLRHTLTDKTTVLHRAAKLNCPEVLKELIRHEEKYIRVLINQVESKGMTPLHVASLAGNAPCVKILLLAGCDVTMRTTIESHNDCTALHLASSKGHSKVVETLLEHNSGREVIESKDSHGCTPLHLACQYGQRECIRKLLLSGADLSAKTNKEKTTAISLLFTKVSRPIALLEEILDSEIHMNGFPLHDPQCVITIDYKLLVPREKPNKQMKVLDALLDTGIDCNQESLVLHPVVESFLFLKWRCWRRWFYYSFVMYIIFLFCFSILVVSIYHLSANGHGVPQGILEKYVRLAILVTLLWLVALEAESVYRLPKYYFTDLESWVKWSSYILAFTVTIFSPNNEWHRLVATVAILLSWTELMFQMSKNPNWGFYINMFSKVAVNVLKVLLTFIFLIIGFALAFMVQFKSEPPFETPWEAFVKTIVMMTSEFEYSSLFKKNENNASSKFGRILFLFFLLTVGIVLMNLLVGLAVSDINSLETQGKMNRLRKQADFLRVIQPSDLGLWFMSNCLKKITYSLREVQPPIKICPGSPWNSEQLALPKQIVDAIIARAEKQGKTEKICKIQNVFKKLNELITSLNKSPFILEEFNSQSCRRYLQKTKGQRDAHNEVRERSRYEFANFTARKLDNIEMELTTIKASIKELAQFLPQELSIQIQ
ncbi:transient receptor potential channel pyrexia [Cryptotermes secundus]|uniref:transient receptor potential channel pyrexia n=1 Tax=Cryptotermes secundus TaxID=105785 RepID=UPI000CD7D368|nr:transient receptor potential channel pyrexia [Cryptotermes secundus]